MKIKGLHDITTPTCIPKCIVAFHFEYKYLYSGSQYIQNNMTSFHIETYFQAYFVIRQQNGHYVI